jgi:pimeloyl-ACP methyl ester carboxylesterase
VRQVLLRGGLFAVELREIGAGAPLLFLQSEWGPPDPTFVQALAATRRVLDPSHPGVGATTGDGQIHDLGDLLIYYLDLLDALDLRDLPLVGHGLGGMIAAELAALQPERFTRLVLIAPLGLWDPAEPVLDFFAATPAELAAALYHDPTSPAATARAAVPPEGDGYVEFMLARASSMAVAAKYLWPIPNRGLARRLHRVGMPTLLIWGASDRLCPPGYGHRFQRALPAAELVVIPAAGHLPDVEQPARLAELIDQFV